MFRSIAPLLTLSVFAAALAVASPARADNEGQADLDKAAELKLSAETHAELEKVVELAESALKKGLDKDQTAFAKEMLAATLFQNANRRTESIFGQSPPSSQWPRLRQIALRDLEKAKIHDPKLPDIYLLEAKLQALPAGDEKAAQAAIDQAVKLLTAADQVKQLSKALVLRAAMSDDKDKQLADFDAAVKADPENSDAWQGRALIYLERGESEKAIADLEKLVEKEANNPAAIGALAEALTNMKKYDEALKYCGKVIELAPRSTLGYSLRARVHILKDDLKAGLSDLNEAVKINPNDLPSLLMRSRLNAAEGKHDEARADIEKVLRLAPDLPQAILMRSVLAAQKDKYGEAIADVQILLQTDPTNVEYRLQLATYMVGDKRPRKAIDVLTSIIEGMGDKLDDEQKETKSDALRARGDALLSVGKHADAIKDYDEALKLDPENTGVLNNLAWVLATSPDDGVRNAERSIELGTKACELTKFEKPHILSTLASGYAEKGDWETAVKWSNKAVELGGKEDVGDQLKKELESYKEKKPWREKQEIEENTKPLGAKPNELET
ncbi:MAG: tetratricopeptide repeat protein [Planctomycetaceae bacterium]|nr:tetratricopeptide repeat protein [Planctomycetaceae bacterium]